jgi:hypothetical protein
VVLALSPLALFHIVLFQAQKVLLILGESARSEGAERWYTDRYLADQLQRLQQGKPFSSLHLHWTLMLVGLFVYTSIALHRVMCIFPLRLVSCTGRWRDLHLSAVQGRCDAERYTTPVRFATPVATPVRPGFATASGAVTRGTRGASSVRLGSAVCKDRPHDGEAPDSDMPGDSDELVPFVPGVCIP